MYVCMCTYNIYIYIYVNFVCTCVCIHTYTDTYVHTYIPTCTSNGRMDVWHTRMLAQMRVCDACVKSDQRRQAAGEHAC
jgi:hypothetical protein